MSVTTEHSAPSADPLVAGFYARTRTARKVMVIDLGFLGDTVHLVPSLRVLRHAYPQAELHVTVSTHVTSVLGCFPWVNQVWGYMRYPRHATLRENWEIIARLRREQFDAVINLNGSDRSSWLTFLSGAPARLGRRPSDGGPWFWDRLFTARVNYPFGLEPLYLQRLRCLERAGFPVLPPAFDAAVHPVDLSQVDLTPADRGTYFHISPFTTADHKELPKEQLAALIVALGSAFPGQRVVLSCAPTPRELGKMEQLLKLLPARPWRVLAGTLNLSQLAAVIAHSTVHLCGDTGPLHLAVMTRTPMVTWFWPNPGRAEWVPNEGPLRVLSGTNPPGQTFLAGVTTEAIVAAVRELVVDSGGTR